MTEEKSRELERRREHMRKVLKLKAGVKCLEEELKELKEEQRNTRKKKEIEELERRIEKEKDEYIKEYSERREEITNIKDEVEKSLLIYKYLMGWTNEKIADKLGYSEEQIRRIHNRAITKIGM